MDNPAAAAEPRCSESVGGAEESQAHQGTGQVQEALQQVRAPPIAHPETAAAKQPGERPLHHPAVPTQSFGRVYAAASGWCTTAST
jgi:hypothetical protein